VGKTRLALAAGERLVPAFPDGVVVVDLAVVRDPSLVLGAVATQLGLVDTGTRPLLDRLQAYLAERALLLLLDNFEHLLTAASALPPLLAAAPRTRILVTSRVPLRLRWEQTIRLSPLPVPDLEDTRDVETLVRVPSVALLIERVQAQQADYTPTAQQVPFLIALTRQLDGLPLALELAAALAQTLPLAVIARRLERHMQSLRWDAYDLPERHHSLEAALGWSYQLLAPAEQRLFRHLGVFVGRVSPDAVAAVLGEGDEDEVLDRLTVLAEQSLVAPAGTDEDAEPSFGMLETVREYARELLATAGELDATSEAHATYFIALAEQGDPELRGRHQRLWLRRLGAEQDNFRAALRWLLNAGQDEQALQLAGALGSFWWRHGHFTEGGQWLEEALSKQPNSDPAVQIRALVRAARLWAVRDDPGASTRALQEALSLAQAQGDRPSLALALTFLGTAAIDTRDLVQGERLLQDALTLWEGLGDGYHSGYALAGLAYVRLQRGQFREAVEHYAAAIARFQSIGELEEAIELLFPTALAQLQLGDRSAAARLIQEGVTKSRDRQARWLVIMGSEATLLLVKDSADVERRVRLLGAVDALAEATGYKTGPVVAAAGLSLDALREQMEYEQLRPAYRAGHALRLEEAATLALELLGEIAPILDGGEHAAKTPAEASPLSAREQEVLRLVAEGLTSKQIGQQLFLSPRTVDHHLNSVFNKLGVDSRAQAVAVATRDGLV
jgi:non-specific serine/threonine protein kinase